MGPLNMRVPFPTAHVLCGIKMTREEIVAFFEGVIVNGITRKVVFLKHPEQGRIEVDLVSPVEREIIGDVHLSFPADDISLKG
jgi:hypothetical protein